MVGKMNKKTRFFRSRLQILGSGGWMEIGGRPWDEGDQTTAFISRSIPQKTYENGRNRMLPQSLQVEYSFLLRLMKTIILVMVASLEYDLRHNTTQIVSYLSVVYHAHRVQNLQSDLDGFNNVILWYLLISFENPRSNYFEDKFAIFRIWKDVVQRKLSRVIVFEDDLRFGTFFF